MDRAGLDANEILLPGPDYLGLPLLKFGIVVRDLLQRWSGSVQYFPSLLPDLLWHYFDLSGRCLGVVQLPLEG